MKVEESLNVTFNESPHPTKLSPLIDDDVGEEEAIKNYTKAYIKEMLKKFGLEDSKPTKTPMSTEIKLTKDDEAKFVDRTKYRGLWYPKGTGVETIVYADSDHADDYVDRKSTSDVYRNKIYDPGICIEVESTRFLATFSLVIDTLLPFSSKNENKVFNHDVLASKEKSPPSLSHRGFKASKLFHYKSPMLIYGENIPILDVPIAPDFEASRARGFVLRSLELQSSTLLRESNILILSTNVYL
ncbi:hypothetical protein Tco_0348859 [Tanacetum coccineum]